MWFALVYFPVSVYLLFGGTGNCFLNASRDWSADTICSGQFIMVLN